MKIPPAFDHDYYLKENPALLSKEEAHRHFVDIGRPYGLSGSPACDQGYFIRFIQHLNPASVLEIGPGSSPKLRGPNIFYFDVKSEAELRDRYRQSSDADQVPGKIHFVEPNGDLSVVDRKFDIIFSSHVIEHTTDLVKHLQQIASLLTEGGHYFLVAPSKKYTFDYFKPTTTLEEVMSVHMEPGGREAHFLKSFLLEELRRTHNEAARHWAGDHGEPGGVRSDYETVQKRYRNVKDRHVARSGFHRWCFDEQSFEEVIGGLHSLGMSPLKIHGCYNTLRNNLSFNAILSL